MQAYKQHTIPEARAALQQLLRFYTVHEIVDQLAEVCAEHAQEVEPMDAYCAAQWDKACGKLALVTNQLAI